MQACYAGILSQFGTGSAQGDETVGGIILKYSCATESMKTN